MESNSQNSRKAVTTYVLREFITYVRSIGVESIGIPRTGASYSKSRVLSSQAPDGVPQRCHFRESRTVTDQIADQNVVLTWLLRYMLACSVDTVEGGDTYMPQKDSHA